MENTRDYFDDWLKTQQKMFTGFMEDAKRTQQLFLGLGTPGISGDAAGFQRMYSSWTSAVLGTLAEAGSTNMQAVKDGLSKVLGSSNAYLKLYEVWLPVFKAMQEKSLTGASYQAFVDPAKYKELIDSLFGFDAEAVKLMLDQSAQVMALYSGSAQRFTKPWADAARESMTTFPQFVEGHPESFMKMYHSMFNAFDSTLGRIFHVPPVGKDREKIELLLRSFDDLSVYAVKNTEYQHMMYVTGLTAMQKVVATLAEKMKSGEEIKEFGEFFDLWIDVSEQTYFALFQTEDFGRLQGELLDSSLNVRKHFFKLMEMHLYDLPIALRSEMDDLYKTIYDLKKKVRKLETQLREASP
jgi:class III poly(R)-hydroxyalkanoic acid synthase PhaE subunit